MGVFSVIQKNKIHHSNIYSGAPMPFMQRITWSRRRPACRRAARLSGVAWLHPHADGVCREDVELDPDGRARHHHARLMTPANFAHPLLAAQKVVPLPLIANDPAADAPALKSDKGADAGQAIKPAASSLANSEPGLELRSTVGHAMPMRERTHTADAGSALSAANGVVTMSDATPSTPRKQSRTRRLRPTQPRPPRRPRMQKSKPARKRNPTLSTSRLPQRRSPGLTKPRALSPRAPKSRALKPSPNSKPADKPAEPARATADRRQGRLPRPTPRRIRRVCPARKRPPRPKRRGVRARSRCS